MNNINFDTNEQKSWNPVLNMFVEIKQEFINEFGEKDLYSYDKDKTTCLEYWIEKLGNEEYKKLIRPLYLKEYKNELLLKYTHSTALYPLMREIGKSVLQKDNMVNQTNKEDIEKQNDLISDCFWKAENGFYSECRSTVIDIYNDSLIITPFKKFRNLNEGCENSLENVKERIRNATIVEFTNKLDGSMMCARFYNGSYVFSSTAALDEEKSWRIEDAKKMFFSKKGYQTLAKDYPDYTFVFEYISLRDAHVVKYNSEQQGLYLIGMRDTTTGIEKSYKDLTSVASDYGIPTTEMYQTSLECVLNNLDKKKSNEAEGFVLNIDGFKVKIKYDDYLKMKGLNSKLAAPDLVIESIAEEKFDDFVSKVPDKYKEVVYETSALVFEYIEKAKRLCKYYVENGPKTSTKDFMIYVNTEVPESFKAYVRNMYLNIDINFIKGRGGHYKNQTEIEKNLSEINEKLSEYQIL